MTCMIPALLPRLIASAVSLALIFQTRLTMYEETMADKNGDFAARWNMQMYMQCKVGKV